MKQDRNRICPCGSGLKFKRCCINKQIHTPAKITFSVEELLSFIKFGLEHIALVTIEGKNINVKDVSIGNGGDTIVVSFNTLFEKALDIKTEIASIMGYLSGAFKGESYQDFDIKFFAARALDNHESEIMYAVCPKKAASTIANGDPFEWLKSTIFQENTVDFRLIRAKTMISDIENGLRKVIANLYMKKLGENWWDIKIETKVSSTIKHNYENQFGNDCSDGNILIKYTYTLDLKKIISADWGMFRHLFESKAIFESRMFELNIIRREEAHNRHISEQHLVELEKIYTALLEKIANLYPDVTVNYLLENWRAKIKDLMFYSDDCIYTKAEFETSDLFGKHSFLVKDISNKITFWGNAVIKLKSLNPPLSKRILHEELISLLEHFLKILNVKLNRVVNVQFDDIEDICISFNDHLKKMKDFSSVFAMSES